MRALPQVKSAHEFKPNYPEFARLLQKLPASFAVVPLEDSPFNRAKSPIKWLEYSACRIPGVYSDIAAYNQTVENGRTGLLAPNTREAWFSAMKSLVENPALRCRLAEQAHQTVLARHTVEHNARLWLEAYESLFAAPAAPAAPARPPAAAPAVSIVIPVFNKIELTRGCLESISRNTPASDYEVIVVDNGSADGTPGS